MGAAATVATLLGATILGATRIPADDFDHLSLSGHFGSPTIHNAARNLLPRMATLRRADPHTDEHNNTSTHDTPIAVVIECLNPGHGTHDAGIQALFDSLAHAVWIQHDELHPNHAATCILYDNATTILTSINLDTPRAAPLARRSPF